MGASTELYAFDHARLVRDVAPGLRALLRGDPLPDWLEAIWQVRLDRAHRSETGALSRYHRDGRWTRESVSLQAVRELALDLDAVCTVLEGDLGVADLTVGTRDRHRLAMAGGCAEHDCPAASRCPLHPASRSDLSYLVMTLFQEAFDTTLDLEAPWGSLGRYAQLRHLLAWYALELDAVGAAREAVLRTAQDPLPTLFVRLGRRGAVWGWGDGGSSEGLHGWLTTPETRALVDALAPYDLSDTAEVPAAVAAMHETETLQDGRRLVAELRRVAQACAERGRGIVMLR
jgi:hypothetical protein